MIRVAVVGLGKMGLLHASLLRAIPGVELAGLCERSRLVRLGARRVIPDVPVVGDVTALRDLGLDAVYVTTPPSSHHPIISTILSQRIAPHIFSEKPLATGFDQARAMCELAAASPGVHAVGYHKRFAGSFRRALSLLRDGAIGVPRSFEATAFSADFAGAGPAMRQAAARGTALRDHGCHAVDLAVWFFDEFTVERATVMYPDASTADDSAEAFVRTASGTEGVIRVSSCRPEYRLPQISISIVGSAGQIVAADDYLVVRADGRGETRLYRHDLDDRVEFLLADPEYSLEDAAFVRAIGGEPFIGADFEAAARVERAIDAIQSAARQSG